MNTLAKEAEIGAKATSERLLSHYEYHVGLRSSKEGQVCSTRIPSCSHGLGGLPFLL